MSVGIYKDEEGYVKVAGNAKNTIASNVLYNNGTSELQANNVQSAIDELSTKVDGFPLAENIQYDNNVSGLQAEWVQDAIDILAENVGSEDISSVGDNVTDAIINLSNSLTNNILNRITLKNDAYLISERQSSFFKIGNICFLDITLKNSVQYTQNATVIATLPSDCRPTSRVDVLLRNDSSQSIYILPSGDINIFKSGGVAKDTLIHFTVFWSVV